MIKFALGVIVTLAILYPDNTKALLGKAVDTTNSVATQTVKEVSK